ncbi:MAG TPA: non-homologous end-joining DNA ligase [Bryobacteraceae bacterium]|nr:non-homologous end-joining DNA ligase [Bryobacteraceae bacterium]
MGAKSALEIEGRAVPVSNLEKQLYPAGFTKAQVIDFYIRVSRWLLPHLKDRPVTLKRYPDGVRGEHFYEKDAPGFTPDWVATFPVPRRGGGKDIRYILINDLATLVWCANLANLELHPFLHRVPSLDTPDYVVFDLDPGEGANVLTCAEVAFLLRDILSKEKLNAFPKVSGSKGIQIYVPLHSGTMYADTQPFARKVAETLAGEHPKLIVAEMAKALRHGRVFIDWSQNSDYKTTAGVYSLRGKRDTPYVSMPVRWEDLEAALKKRDSATLYFEPAAALERLERIGDLFAPVLTLKQELPGAARRSPARSRPAGKTATKTAPRPRELSEYRRKRDFSKTAEPSGDLPRASSQGGRRRFVIQKHAASHLHFDFRLEMHGVLKSWAVPKGMPYAVDEKRLAMATEDHPLDYFSFEGTIPESQYGGGTVMVWDIGTYEVIEGNVYKGFLRLFLTGKKLKGEWVLRRAEERNWFLQKTSEPMKPLTPKKESTSALSGRTMNQIAEARDAVWHSNRPEPELAGLPDSPLEFVEPMQAKLISELPEASGWQYEIKLDGYRALAIRKGDRVLLLSRNNNELNGRFPSIAKACEALPEGAMLDGEIVALDSSGRPAFNLLQNWHTVKAPLLYYAFDLIAYRGKDLKKLPLSKRRELLERSALAGLTDPIRLSGALEAPGAALLEAARKQGIEGFVAKRLDSIYEAGRRSGAWVKLKVNQGQELVIGGYIPGSHGFDALLVGYYEQDRLIFIAKIRNGFTPKLREEIFRRFKGLEAKAVPFANLPEPKGARRGMALTAEAMKQCVWLKPKLVAQIEYTDWTKTDHLRHARFAGLREDKNPREVVKETAP